MSDEPTRVLVCDDQSVVRAGYTTILSAQPVAAGESLLSPAVTRRLIGRYAGRIRPSDPAAPKAGHPLSELTPREREVLSLIASGMSNAEIARELFISAETVKTYVSRILAKLGLHDRVQAVVFAYREGLVSALAGRVPLARNAMVAWSAQVEPVPKDLSRNGIAAFS